MARTLDPEAHSLRRDAFMDVAQQLIQTRGYERLSLQDILDELGASKGAFYHYFATKEALFAALIDRTTEAAVATVIPIVDDPGLSAVDKMAGVFSGIARWKGERSELMLEVIRVWFSDDNVVVREQLRRSTAIRLTPLLTRIVRQGTLEGTFSCASPEGTARVLISVMQGLNEVASELFIARQAGTVSFEDVERTMAAYGEAYQRILGLQSGSWAIPDQATLRQWFA